MLADKLNQRRFLIPLIIASVLFWGILLLQNIHFIDCYLNSERQFEYKFYTTNTGICFSGPKGVDSRPYMEVIAFPGSDPNSFELIWGYLAKDKNNVFYVETETPCEECHTKVISGKVVEGGDPETFHIDEDGIPRDKHRTYERLAEPWEYFEK